jgi:hypothetical protein
VFTPAPDDPMDFEQTVEATLVDWNQRFRLRKVLYDPLPDAGQRAGGWLRPASS